MTTAVSDPAFQAHAPGFDEVLGDDPRPSLVAQVDAHEGPVYLADEDALYFTTVPRPGTDRSPSVQIKRLPLEDPERISVLVAQANGANGMTADRNSQLLVCEQGSRWQPARVARVDLGSGQRETVVQSWRGFPSTRPTIWSSQATARSGSPTRPTVTSRASGQSHRSAISCIDTTRPPVRRRSSRTGSTSPTE